MTIQLTDTERLVLRAVDIFEGLPDDVLQSIRGHMEERREIAGSLLFAEDDVADCVFFVREGTVQIVKSQDGGSAVLARRGPGELIGEMALVDASSRFATAVCETNCRLLVLPRSRFFEVISAHPSIAERIMRVMSARVREADVKRLRILEGKNRELESARIRLEASLVYRDRVLACSPYPIVVTDTGNTVQLVNDAAHHLFGDHQHARLWDWMAPKDPAVDTSSDSYLTTGSTWQSEVELIGPERKVLFCKIVAVPIADSGEGRAARLWIFEDLTEFRALQQRALDRERLALKGEMAGEIAHELNNYLAVLMGNVELLPMYLGAAVPPQAQKSLGNIQHALSQIALFTESLLRSRHPAGKRVEIDFNDFVKNQIAFLHPQKRLKKVIINTDWGDAIPKLECDAAGLQQVFYNLLLNAADALSDAGPEFHKVWVTTRFDQHNQSIQLTVADDGPGLSPDVLSGIFKERVSTKPTGHGFGLLTIARIIQEHGGTITPGNREGGGAQFVVSLPVGGSTG